jgi:oxygen-independent coproporphyrinogen III oxidase
MKNLFQKYDVPAPRYTSYPTVPYWETSPTPAQWCENLQLTLQKKDQSLAIYIHIPYCETLCTFCGCNTVITKDHKKEDPYIQSVLKEWSLYLEKVPEIKKTVLKHLHLGGGTPTFMSAENLEKMLRPILSQVTLAEDFEGSIEVDPRRTTIEQLKSLRKMGFNRISLGVQDFNPEVQRLINRIQPFDITANLTKEARALGFHSVNFDLIYGLAKQTEASMLDCIAKTIELKPDRIALYSLALVPWIKPAQRLFKDEDLPQGEQKRKLYEVSRLALLKAGYVEIGMDHFALPTEALSKSLSSGALHRNFMGYTDHKTDVLLGLGVSAISETAEMFHQNEKVLPTYQNLVDANGIPTFRGHILTKMDQENRQQILEFMTKGKVKLSLEQKIEAQKFLAEMYRDQLVDFNGNELLLTEKGKPFLRNACLFFDQRLKNKQPSTQVFSKSL